jgi:hypothetical protein
MEKVRFGTVGLCGQLLVSGWQLVGLWQLVSFLQLSLLELSKTLPFLEPSTLPPPTHPPTHPHPTKPSNHPPQKVVLAFAKRVVSAMETGDMSKEPYITFPLLPLAHIVNVSLPGQVRGRGV